MLYNKNKQAEQTVVPDAQAVHWNYRHIPAMQQHRSCAQLMAEATHTYHGYTGAEHITSIHIKYLSITDNTIIITCKCKISLSSCS